MKTATLIKPEQLAAIRNLSLRARLIVEGFMAGMHKSPFHGFSVEFLEYRHYHAGSRRGLLTGESSPEPTRRW